MKQTIPFILGTLLFVSCGTVPITGRKQFNIVKDADVLPASFNQYKSFLEKNKVSKDAKSIDKIKSIGAKVSAAVDRFMRTNGMQKEADSYKWEFNLVEDETVNAWCLPGGKVVFYTGILPICDNDDGIAVVMGHEVAHAFAKHGQERMSQGQLQSLGGVAVALGTSGKSENVQTIWNSAFGIGSQVGMLAFSRKHETEADKLGLVFMIMAGYDGTEAAKLWVRMSEASKGKKSPPQLLSTHPSHKDRIKELNEYLPEAQRLAKQFNEKAAQILKD